MSVAQAHWVYKSMQKREAQQRVLNKLSGETQRLWKEFSSAPHWDKRPHKLGLDICVVCLIVYFFFKGELISFKKGKEFFVDFIDRSNKRYEELSKREEIISTLNLLEQKGIA